MTIIKLGLGWSASDFYKDKSYEAIGVTKGRAALRLLNMLKKIKDNESRRKI